MTATFLFCQVSELSLGEDAQCRRYLETKVAEYDRAYLRRKGWVEDPLHINQGYWKISNGSMPDRFLMDLVIYRHLIKKLLSFEPVDLHEEWCALHEQMKREGGFSPQLYHDIAQRIHLCVTENQALVEYPVIEQPNLSTYERSKIAKETKHARVATLA